MSCDNVISERFTNLRKSQKDKHGKDMPVAQLAQELLESQCITNYTIDVIRQEIGKVERTNKFPQLFLIEGYSKYFNVTSDYLLGLRETKAIDENIAMINKTTGLNESSINTLEILKRSEYIDILNYILNDYYTFATFLSNLSLYFDNEYDTPVHFDKEKSIFVESEDITENSILKTNGERYLSVGKRLDNDVCGHPAYKSISVPVSILESHALYCIQETINLWKQKYKGE